MTEFHIPPEEHQEYVFLMASIGIALDAWSKIEGAMFVLFYAASDIVKQETAHAIFDGIISLEVRLAVLDRVIETTSLPPLENEMWHRLSARIRKFYVKRHEIAHFSTPLPEEGVVTNRISPFFTWEKHYRKSLRYLGQQAIEQRTAKFREISSAISWFWKWFPPPSEGRQPEQEEPPLIPKLRVLATRILEECERQRPASRG